MLVRGLRLLNSVEALGHEFSFSQTMVLLALLSEREMSMNGLAQYLGLSKANACGLVDRLVRKKLLVRSRSVADRRLVIVRLSRAGACAAQQLASLHQQGIVMMMKRIPERDLGVFMTTLEGLASGLAQARSSSVSRSAK